MVPVFFHKETWKGMELLCDETIREQVGISRKNKYIFASTRGSDSHVSGWHCMNDVLEQLQIKGKMNPTSNRHRVANLMAKFELSHTEHFGHSKDE